MLAEAECDLGVMMRNDPIELLDGDPWARAHWLAERCGLDAAAIWEWGVVERVTSGLRCTRINLQPLGRHCLRSRTASPPCEQSCTPTSAMCRMQQSPKTSRRCTSEVPVGDVANTDHHAEQRCSSSRHERISADLSRRPPTSAFTQCEIGGYRSSSGGQRK
jgi:hypothetical protein